jgi:uncharacterized protein YqiB (DUF1249 family)
MYSYTVGDTVELYERNYAKLLHLAPELRELCDGVTLALADGGDLQLRVVERGRYCSLVALCHGVGEGAEWLRAVDMQVRLYHDARVAEVVAYQRQVRFRSHYDYPNPTMRSPMEKRKINVFLGEWLSHCLAQGLHMVRRGGVTSA